MTEYYVRTIYDGMSFIEDFWAVDENVAHQGVMPSQLGTHNAVPDENILAMIQERFPGQFHKLMLRPGEYFPRMARPSSTLPECSPGYNPDQSAAAHNIRTTSTGQLHALIQELQQICRVIHPTCDNFEAYGHEIRNIIIIACTEIEAHWKNILRANGQKAESRREYVKLSPAMRLGEYRVALPWYPWLKPITPFENWMPTEKGKKQFLPWYDAYNAIKHDRENNFSKAKLIHALTSVIGCFVMLAAQYGLDFVKSGTAAEGTFFLLIKSPTWSPSEIYVPSHGALVTGRLYPFGI